MNDSTEMGPSRAEYFVRCIGVAVALGFVALSVAACPSESAPLDSAADTAGLGDIAEVGGNDVVQSDGQRDPGQELETTPADVEDVEDAQVNDPGTTDDGAAEVTDSEVTAAEVTGDGDGDGDGDTPADAPNTDTDTDTDTLASGVTDTPWGPIDGPACGALSDPLLSSDPSFHVTTWTFQAATFDPSVLGPKPLERYEEPNAGGSSKCSEVMSMTWLIECQMGTVYKKETEIVYDTLGAITDYAMTVDGNTIGVSVTRAYLGPFNQTYTIEDATTLLDKKLEGINESTMNVSAGDAWTKQILHIWTLQPDWVPTLQAAWASMDASLKADTVVLVTIEEGSDYIVTDSCDD